MLHIMSVISSRSILDSQVQKWVKTFGEQELWHYAPIEIGGKKDWNSRQPRYIDAQQKYLVVDFSQNAPNSYRQVWELVDDIKAFQQEKGFDIATLNHEYQLANKDKWLTTIDRISKSTLGHDPYIRPIEVDENKMGLYVVHEAFGKIIHMVYVRNQKELFDLFDAVETIAVNFSIGELVLAGYISVADHTSWLGQGGKHVHAVVAYFRQIGEKYIYFNLDTWCGGNHWKANEHSPKPLYPNEDTVTCKKCLKVIAKKKKS